MSWGVKVKWAKSSKVLEVLNTETKAPVNLQGFLVVRKDECNMDNFSSLGGIKYLMYELSNSILPCCHHWQGQDLELVYGSLSLSPLLAIHFCMSDQSHLEMNT